MTDNYGPPPEHGPIYERLGVFVGKWHATGKSYGGGDQDEKNPRASTQAWVSDEITNWHPGKFFLIQHEDANVGTSSLITHAIIGYDPASGEYFAHAVENHGYYRKYAVSVAGRIWTFASATERARMEFSADGSNQQVLWEWRPRGDKWLPLCERTNMRTGD